MSSGVRAFFRLVEGTPSGCQEVMGVFQGTDSLYSYHVL
jgi:hypothetical protein